MSRPALSVHRSPLLGPEPKFALRSPFGALSGQLPPLGRNLTPGTEGVHCYWTHSAWRSEQAGWRELGLVPSEERE